MQKWSVSIGRGAHTPLLDALPVGVRIHHCLDALPVGVRIHLCWVHIIEMRACSRGQAHEILSSTLGNVIRESFAQNKKRRICHRP